MQREPLVACVCLTADRNQFLPRCVKSYLTQTYENKSLLIFDNGAGVKWEPLIPLPEIVVARADQFRGKTIGALRNAANELVAGADIIAHFDVDDFSHPYRLAEQVNLLQASRADVVGYHDMLMWAHRPATEAQVYGIKSQKVIDCVEEAHLFHYDGPRAVNTYALETSFLYWRSAWERLKFPDSNTGDYQWLKDPRVRCVSMSSVEECEECRESGNAIRPAEFCAPRMIAEIHGSNTVMRPDLLGSHNFTRVSEWDSYCRERMKL